jgi:hypothetical protein
MMTERSLVEKMKEALNPKFKKIWIHKKPSASSKIKEKLISSFGNLPILQPEFDMIFKTFDDKLMAIETKSLVLTDKGHNMAYYQGIGQALSLLRFGFDHVGLWLFVDPQVTDNNLNKYGAESWHFIRNEVKLPIEYSYFKIDTSGLRLKFQVMQYTSQQSGYELIDIGSPNFQITWKYKNPLMKSKNVQILRKHIESFLNERD